MRKSKYKHIFAKDYTPNWSEEIFVIKKIKNTVPWTHVIDDLLEHSMKRVTKDKPRRIYNRKSNQEKGEKLYVKWKGHDNSFNSWIDQEDLV